MIQAKIIITVQYAHDADMGEAVDDQMLFTADSRRFFSSSVDVIEDIQIDYSVVETSKMISE